MTTPPKAECKAPQPNQRGECENMKCTYEGFDGERSRCEVCGQTYFLDYEEMK